MWDSIMGYLLIPGQQLTNLLVSIFFAAVLAGFIAVVYKITHQNMNYERAVLTTLVAIAPIVTMIMFFIQGNLVLSLGLVGSLSIIRFRTPIKDSRDMVFLFWSIAVGLGCGTYNWTTSIAATLVIAVVVTIMFLIRYKRPTHGEFILVISGTGTNPQTDIENVIGNHRVFARIRSYQCENERWETIYELQSSKPGQELLNSLITELNNIDGVKKISLLAPQLALPV